MTPGPEALHRPGRPATRALVMVLTLTGACGGTSTRTVAHEPTQPQGGEDMALVDPAELATKPVCGAKWPLWEAYKRAFIEPDGRVVDHFAKHTTSEGQAYAMFHALVARDREAFAKVFVWARDHLAGGDVGARLPAWKWVTNEGGAGGRVADPNAASDADLWMAYALVHAAATFAAPEYAVAGGRLLALIERREVTEIAGLGPMMLPGPVGFEVARGYRLNPSYLPVPLLRWAARMNESRRGAPWSGMVEATVRMAEGSTPERLHPDWVIWDTKTRRFVPDEVIAPLGSYDAIRSYLWPALMASEDPVRGRLLACGAGLLTLTRGLGFVPERVPVWEPITDRGALSRGPVGFLAVMQVVARAQSDEGLAASLGARIAEVRREDGLHGEPAFYYDHNLLLFAQGALQGRYAFRADGGLSLPREGARCD